MFTHDPSVWADLGMILWAAGLSAKASWTIATETSAGIRKGDYVQGTVCLVLGKREGKGAKELLGRNLPNGGRRGASSDRFHACAGRRWRTQLQRCHYQLAAYAAALKVLTQYGNIDGRDVEHEVFRCPCPQGQEQATSRRSSSALSPSLRLPDPAWPGCRLARPRPVRALLPARPGHRVPR